jgi:hypothetical protein
VLYKYGSDTYEDFVYAGKECELMVELGDGDTLPCLLTRRNA